MTERHRLGDDTVKQHERARGKPLTGRLEKHAALPTGSSKTENKDTQKTKSPAPFSFLCSQTSLTDPEGTRWSERQRRLPR